MVLAGVRVEALDRLEGLRILLEDGSWALVRASGTEPLFRLYAEAGGEKQLSQIQQELMEAMGIR
ncbi:hypothetical protein [Syntrophomonas palmitatica]|uniref:hypothetical protein n=1 Tax=Syntrophomonas palmitatica TaxID=402877 RepID=UPI0034E2B279